MTDFIALLRAVNVGGTGMLPMTELRALCTEIGWRNVRTYIQSGNVLFESALAERELTAQLEQALTAKTGKHIGVVIRTRSELQAILDRNPFRDAIPAQVGITFLAEPAPNRLELVSAGPGGERLAASEREIFVHYPGGMGRSKLRLPPLVAAGTTRNLNTVSKLVAMTAR